MQLVAYLIAALIWIGMLIGVWYLAESRGREPGTWLVVAVLLSPLLALVILAVIGRETTGDPEPEKARSAVPDSSDVLDVPPSPKPGEAGAAVGATPAGEQPAKSPVVAAEARKGAMKICGQCATEVDEDEAARDGVCPNCQNPWY